MADGLRSSLRVSVRQFVAARVRSREVCGSVIAAIKLYDPSELPDTMLVTAVTLGELSYGPDATDDPAKRAGRIAVLQDVEATFDRLPYDQAAARVYGQICAAVRTAGRQPRKRASELMIAATAASNDLPQ